MPFYRVNGLVVHIKMSGKAPAPCAARVGLQGQEQRCCGISGYLCDWPAEEGHTCSAPLCEAHAHQVGRNRHYCPRHDAEHQAQQPQLGLFTSLVGGE